MLTEYRINRYLHTANHKFLFGYMKENLFSSNSMSAKRQIRREEEEHILEIGKRQPQPPEKWKPWVMSRSTSPV